MAETSGTRVGIAISLFTRIATSSGGSEEQAILNASQAIHEQDEQRPVAVTVHWGAAPSGEEAERAFVARELAVAIRKNIPPIGRSCELAWGSLPPTLENLVHHVRIDRLVDYVANVWQLQRSPSRDKLRADEIRACIAERDGAVPGFLEYCDSAWLLIATEGTGPLARCELSLAAREEAYVTRFSRVFFLNAYPREILEFRAIPTP